MAEKPSQSKLKRKKSSVEDLQSDFPPRGTPRRGALVPGEGSAEPGSSVAPAAVWWNRKQLPAVEALWALTLKSAQLYLQDQDWDLVPDLPEASAAVCRLSALDEKDPPWCDLNEDVAPFPEPSLRTSSSPGPLRLSPSQQDLPVQTVPEPSSHGVQLRASLHSSSQSEEEEGEDEEEERGGLVSEEEERGGLVSEEEERGGPVSEEEERGGPVSEEEERGGLVSEEEERGGPVSEEEERGGPVSEEEEGEDEEEERGGGLQSCPMCLLLFPAGFTQMDRDGHLAQCLSEVNVDVTW